MNNERRTVRLWAILPALVVFLLAVGVSIPVALLLAAVDHVGSYSYSLECSQPYLTISCFRAAILPIYLPITMLFWSPLWGALMLLAYFIGRRIGRRRVRKKVSEDSPE